MTSYRSTSGVASRRWWRALLTAIASAAALFAGCEGAGDDTSLCRADTDCAGGFTCLDGTCVAERVDAGKRDAGTPFRPDDAGKPDAGYDAGQSHVDAGPEDGAVDGGRCGPVACLVAGAQCGNVIDECGATVTCGQCPAGEDCVDSQCSACVPQSCQSLGAQCGSVTDNCGQMRDCSAETGGCNNGYECRNRQCVQSCQPASCTYRCGSIDDGCGGTRNCPNNCGAMHFCNSAGYCQQRQCRDETTQLTWRTFGTAQNVSVGGVPWRELFKAQTNDDNGANVHLRAAPSPVRSDSLYLRGANNMSSIPHNATINGVEVRVNIDPRGPDAEVNSLYLTGAGDSSAYRPPRALNDRKGWVNYGGPNDRWGLSASQLTRARLLNPSFGIRFRVQNNSSTAAAIPSVDTVGITVHYTHTVCR